MYSELYTHARVRSTRILAALALMVVTASIIWYVGRDSVPTRASDRTIKEHVIVNSTPHQIGVFWSVDTNDAGWIIYGTDPANLQQIGLDPRDVGKKPAERLYHYVLLQGLEPGQTYYYTIVSDNAIITENGQPFEAQTGPANSAATSLSPIYGTVTQINGSPASGVFAMLIVGNAVPVMSFSGKTGDWLIPLQYVVHKDSLTALPLTEDTPITLQFFTDDRKSLVRSTLGRSRPLPQEIVLGNNYSFIAEEDVLAAEDARGITQPQTIEIRYPKQNAVIPGTAPLIKGSGIPGRHVEARINTNPVFTAQTMVETDGQWNVPVRQTIAPGTYTLTIITLDAKGKTVELTRTFTLIKSGERILGETTEATPSGTLTPSPSGAVTPTIIVETATPQPPTPSPSPDLSITVTATPTPPPPVSGINILPILMGGVGLVVVSMGILILL